MNNAQSHPQNPKRFYSVKDAAGLLGVSTNTIYTYLKEGKLTARRIGRGRFKIPYQELAAYIPNNLPSQTNPQVSVVQAGQQIQTPIKPTFAFQDAQATIGQSAEPETTKSEDIEKLQNISEYDKEITPGLNDLIFMKLFKAMLYFGLGIIYLFSARRIFYFDASAFGNSDFVNYALASSLIFLGLSKLVKASFPKRLKSLDLPMHFLALMVLAFYSYLSLSTQNYARFVFAATLAILDASHIFGKVRKENTFYTFYSEFTKYVLFLSLIGGVVLLIFPTSMPISVVSQFMESSKPLFAFIWFSFLTGGALYFLSSWGVASRLALIYYVIGGMLPLVLASFLSLYGKWDLAYLFYMSGIFAIFLAWWRISNIKIEAERIFYIVFSFLWVGITIIVGLFVVRASRVELRSQARQQTSQKASKLADNLNLAFTQQQAVLTSSVSDENVRRSIKEKDEALAIEEAKDIFEKVATARRVIIYNSDGVAVGVYPRNSLVQGTNFSSREYFRVTKETFRGYISNVFENIFGQPSVVQTEPIFEDSNFIGMIGLSVDLPKLSSDYSALIGNSLDFYVVDENGVFVLSEDPEKIGKKNDELLAVIKRSTQNTQDEVVYSEALANQARLKAYVIAPVGVYASQFSNANIFLSLLLVVNSIFSISIGIIGASKKKTTSEAEGIYAPLVGPQLTGI